MAHKKAAGSTENGRDSAAKRLGVKLADGQFTHSGEIIVRQRGTVVRAGKNVSRGKDDTLYATSDGFIVFKNKMVKMFTGVLKRRTFVSVRPQA